MYRNYLGPLPASFGFFSLLARNSFDITANMCVPMYDFMLLSFVVKFMFRESVTVQFLLKWVNSFRLESFSLSQRKIWIVISVFNQLDAQNLFHNKFYFMPLHVSSTCWLNTEINILRCTVNKTSKNKNKIWSCYCFLLWVPKIRHCVFFEFQLRFS